MTQKVSAGDQAPHAAPGAPTVGASQSTQEQTTSRDSAAPGEERAKCPAPQNSLAVPERHVRVSSPESLLAIVPVLLGFQPETSMVIIGTEAPSAQVKLTLRYDLPDPPEPQAAAEIAWHAAGILSAQRIDAAVAVGYGPGHLVTPVADAFRDRAAQAGVWLTELLRAENERYWSYLCPDASCCLPDGTPFDVKDHPAAVALTRAGTRVLSCRAELAATVASVEGETAESMHHATRRAEEHAAKLVARVARTGRRASARRLIAVSGLNAVAEAISRYRRGDQFDSDNDAAWLTVVLRDLRVRDDAWSRMDPCHREAHLRLWTDLTRRARPGYVPAPASLLAFVAWQSGNGALANVALDRALADNPRYSMALLLRQAIDSGAPPSMARLPMTPEEVAASYDELEAPDPDDPGFSGRVEDSDRPDDGDDLNQGDGGGQNDLCTRETAR
jgi:hypothetical protein